MNDIDEARRARAYKLWEDEGRPEGRHLDHWQRAEDQHEETERQAEREIKLVNSAKPKKESEVPPTAPPPKSVPM